MCVPVAASLPLMTACSDDESTDPYDINYVYIYSPLETDNSLEYKGNGTFLTQIAPECDLNPVRCTKPAPERLVAHFAIDGSLVDDYNKKHGTGYTFLKSAELENASLVIEQGKYISADSLKVKFTDMTEFQSGAEKYILPIALTSVDGSGISISQNSKIFLTFTSTYKVNHVAIASGGEAKVYYSEGKWVEPADSRVSWNNMFSTDWAADDDITLSLEINNNLIDSYNSLNGTNYEQMPNVSLEHAVMHIRKGDLGPEETLVLLSSDNMASLELDKDYVVPVCVTEVSGVGAGKNEDKSVCYLVVKARKLPNYYVAEEPVGTLLTVDDSWKVTVNGAETTGRKSWTELVTNPGRYIAPVKTNVPILIDMGEEKTISSLVVTYYYNANYSLYGDTKIETSLDGVTYEESICSLEMAMQHVILARKLVQARYIRITYPKSRYSYGGYPTGIKIYTPATE